MRLYPALMVLVIAPTAACTASSNSAPASSTATKTSEQSATQTASSSSSASTTQTGQGSGTLAISTLGDYPYTTESVVAATGLSGSLAADAEAFDATAGTVALPNLSLAGKTGLVLGSSTKATTFSANKAASYGACEMVNRARRFLFEAAGGDAWKCRLDAMAKKPAFASILTSDEFKVSFALGEGASYLVKVKVERDGTAITGFTFWECEDGKQTGYRRSKIDPQTLAYVFDAKTITAPDNEDVELTYQELHASAHVNEVGEFIGLKSMDNTTSNIFASGAQSFNRYQIVQSASNVLFQGVQQQTDHAEPTRFVAYHELIDHNTEAEPFALGKLAVGDGAIAIAEGDEAPYVQGWQGDSGSVNAEVPQLAKIREHKNGLPVATAPEAIAFSGDEVTDCATQDALDFAALGGVWADLAPCAGYELDQNDHLSCHEIAQKTATE